MLKIFGAQRYKNHTGIRNKYLFNFGLTLLAPIQSDLNFLKTFWMFKNKGFTPDLRHFHLLISGYDFHYIWIISDRLFHWEMV